MLEFIRGGGPVMYVLLAASIIALTFIIERGLALRWRNVIPPEIEDALERLKGKEGLPRLLQACEATPSALSRLLLHANEHLNWNKQENIDSIETRARHEVTRLERGLVVLEIIVGIAPLLGLAGTLHGLITLFGNLGASGMGAENAAIARGISIALNTTLMGIIVAVPSLIAWSYYSKKVENLAVEMEARCEEFLREQYRGNEAKSER